MKRETKRMERKERGGGGRKRRSRKKRGGGEGRFRGWGGRKEDGEED